jgi:hypothetical protein
MTIWTLVSTVAAVLGRVQGRDGVAVDRHVAEVAGFEFGGVLVGFADLVKLGDKELVDRWAGYRYVIGGPFEIKACSALVANRIEDS